MGSVTCRVVQKDGQKIIEEIHYIIVHQFIVSDSEDPDIYAAQSLWEWENSEQGKFVMNNAEEKPMWHRHLDAGTYGYRYAITAKLEKKKLAEYYLRWGKSK